MHKCEYPDHKKFTDRRIADGKIDNNPRKIVLISGTDAPSHLQLNYNNIVLWRMLLHYPSNIIPQINVVGGA